MAIAVGESGRICHLLSVFSRAS